jgi:mono/diheme cytochrome c family protein
LRFDSRARELDTKVTPVTEIPEHLLRRSRERRAALGLGGGEAPAEGSEAASTPATTTPATQPAAAAPPAPPRAAARAAPAAPPPPKPDPPYIAAAKRRRRIPIWAMPVLGLLPLWAFMYAKAMQPPKKVLTGPLAEGQTVFESNCSSCHGTQGEGGVGYQLSNGEVEKSFDKITDQFSFVYTGNKPYAGKPYGTGRHIGGQKGPPGAMPAWGQQAGGSLTDEQIAAAVCFERYGLNGGDVTSQEYATWCAVDAPNFQKIVDGGFAGAGVQIKLNG